MKKLLFVLLVSIISISCSKSEEATTETDQIIGKWQFGKTIHFRKDGTTYTREPTMCDLQSSMTFSEDHSIFLISYVGGLDGSCDYEPVNNDYFTWVKISTNKYELKLQIPGKLKEINKVKVWFPDSETMIIGETNDDGSISETKYQENYYKRITAE